MNSHHRHPTGSLLLPFLALFITCCTDNLCAQAPCPEVQVVASGLLGPSKIIQVPSRSFLVAEVGPANQVNSARVSIVDQNGHRRTLLEGLPSARAFVGDPSGTSGLYLEGRTLYVVNGQGDITVAGPIQGTEQANPTPASPIFSSVLAVDFPEALETNTSGFVITLADHYALKSGTTLTVTNATGESTKIRLVVDFVDYLPDPRPTFAENVRHSHPYGIVANRTNLYVVDAGFNNVRKVEIATGAEQILVSFPPTPSPLTNGPPVIENVPTSIHWLNGQLLVTTLGGAPFLPGYSKVLQINPQTGAVVLLVEGLTAAIDSTPLASNRLSAGLLTLEYNLSFPRPGPGRLQSFTIPTSVSVTNSGCLETPVSMLIDATAGRLIVAELNTGRLVWLPVPPGMPRPGSIYFSEFAGGRICRANLDGSGKVTLASGLSLPIGPSLDFVRGQMYWGETGAATMRRANLDGTRQTAIVANPNGGMPTLDLVTGRMYWNVSSSGTLQSANLDGSDRKILVTGQNDPHTVELDLANGRIYWPEYGAGNIRRANLDGTGMTNLLRGLASPALMTLDVAGGKMYWTAHGTDDIRRANLDGSGQEILVRSQSDPAGIALDVSSGRIYWADSGTGQIRRANLDGTGQEIVIRGLEGPAFVRLDLSALPPLSVQTPARRDATFTLTWDALMGRAYRVQFKSDLDQTNWANLVSRVTATNTTMTAVDSSVTDLRRFYHVQLLP